jgi:2'-5' RNA ligase
MRLFIAINPPADVVANLAAVQHTLAHTKADISWTDPAAFHITLKFLADAPETLLPEIASRLTKAAAQVPAFPLEVEGVDKFPTKGPARVIISRILSPDNRLTKLHRLIDSGLGGIGLPMDMRALTPHLTLGRVRTNHGLNRLLRLLDKHDLDFFGAFPAATVTLYQSTLTPAGAIHTPLHAATLAVPAPALQPAP